MGGRESEEDMDTYIHNYIILCTYKDMYVCMYLCMYTFSNCPLTFGGCTQL